MGDTVTWAAIGMVVTAVLVGWLAFAVAVGCILGPMFKDNSEDPLVHP